jgi:hypothetical protein
MLEVAQSAKAGGNSVISKSAAFGYDNDGELTTVNLYQDANTHTKAAGQGADDRSGKGRIAISLIPNSKAHALSGVIAGLVSRG